VQHNTYSVLLAEPTSGTGEGVWAVAERLARRGHMVIPAPARDLRARIASGADIGAALLDWDLFGSEREFHAVLDDIRAAGARPPVVLLTEESDEQSVPAAAARRADGFFWLHADSPSYVAGQVERLVRDYAERLLSQFLAELTGGEQHDDWISFLPGPDGLLVPAGDASRCLALSLPAQAGAGPLS
jgi:hypothetical protein